MNCSTSGRRPSSATCSSHARSIGRPRPTGTSGARSSPGRRPTASRTSAAPSDNVPAGPVAVCIDRPILSLDRPFTYLLPAELEAGLGSLVQVPFHGRLIRGWILGPTDDLPPRMLAIKKVVSPGAVFRRRDARADAVGERAVHRSARGGDRAGRSSSGRIRRGIGWGWSEGSVGAGAPGGSGGAPAPLAQPSRSAGAPQRTTLRHRPQICFLGTGTGLRSWRPSTLVPGRSCFGRRLRTRSPQSSRSSVGVSMAGGGRSCWCRRRRRFRRPRRRSSTRSGSGLARWSGGQAGSLSTVAGDRGGAVRRRRRDAAGRVRARVGTGSDRRLSGEPPGPPGGPGAVLPRARCGLAACTSGRRRMRPVGAVSILRSRCAPGHGGRTVDAAMASRRGGASGTRGACAPVGPSAPGDAPGVHLRSVARVRHRAGVSRVRPSGGMRGLRRPAAIGGGRRSVRGVRGTRPVRALRSDGLRDPARRSGACGGVGRVRRPRPGPPGHVAGPGALAKGERGPRGRSRVGARPGRWRLSTSLRSSMQTWRNAAPGLPRGSARSPRGWMRSVGPDRPAGRSFRPTIRATRRSRRSCAAIPTVSTRMRHDAERTRGFRSRRRCSGSSGALELQEALAVLRPTTMLTSSVEGQTVCLLALEPERVAELGRLIRELAVRDIVTRVEAEPHL